MRIFLPLFIILGANGGLTLNQKVHIDKNGRATVDDAKNKIKKDDHIELSYNSLYKKIVSIGIDYPEIAWAQAVLESGHFNSPIFRSNNNLFGMRFPKKRETVAIKEKKGFSAYSDWNKSVEDYKMYQDYIFKDKQISKEKYYDLLDRSYSESGKSYSNKLKCIIKKYNKYIS
jgi:hypothetical protein